MTSSATTPRPWWRGCTIYQIYPRSFQDASGDGVGDLLGIVHRLPHVAALGVDAVWVSPFFASPMKDFGYDVADYRHVDPIFGTLADFDALVATAHALGLRVLIDLVLSHTSDRHPWFRESRANRANPRADWYVWADPRPDGTPPNNWLAVFGGPAWQWDSRRCQYYLHNFLAAQPDLNFHNPEVQAALLDVARFWLDRGVDGFRLDTINFYVHDRALRDNPPLPPELRSDRIAPAVNPYNHQRHLYDRNRPETLDFLRRLRAVMEPSGAAMLGEVGDAQHGLEILGEYTSGGDKAQMCYAFEFLSPAPLTAAYVARTLSALAAAAPDGWACWAFSNHDVMRHLTRWGLTDAAARAHVTLLAMLRGSLCLYQGEELGLGEAELAFEDLRDPYGIEFWPMFRGRDGCRTPMVWQAGALNAGFSAGPTWLPIPREHLRHAVDAAEADPAAILHHYRRVLAFRRVHPALVAGDMDGLAAARDVLSFLREGGGERLFCAINLGEEAAVVTLPPGRWEAVGAEINGGAPGPDGAVHLGPWQPCFLVAA
ncbi:MAG: alpha glucosidase [Rhodobacteraceae bacterium]|nr:alpha glucosidase [Paracoccaceae bacterium]